MTRPLKSLLRIGLAVGLISAIYVAMAQPNNGFDLSNAIIDPAAIVAGGPAKDGIPALDNPAFVNATEAGFLDPQDRILVIEDGRIAEMGSHAELLQQGGIYKRLWDYQSGGFLE